jgi:hypothetical protein
MIRVPEPEPVLPALAFYFLRKQRSPPSRPLNPGPSSEDVTLWDIAGAFTMMGCAAAIFSEPDQAAQFFEQSVEQHPDTPL